MGPMFMVVAACCCMFEDVLGKTVCLCTNGASVPMECQGVLVQISEMEWMMDIRMMNDIRMIEQAAGTLFKPLLWVTIAITDVYRKQQFWSSKIYTILIQK